MKAMVQSQERGEFHGSEVLRDGRTFMWDGWKCAPNVFLFMFAVPTVEDSTLVEVYDGTLSAASWSTAIEYAVRTFRERLEASQGSEVSLATVR